MSDNQQIHLTRRPQGMPQAGDFSFVEAQMPEIGEGQALVRTLYLSVDPYLRGRMSDKKSYVAPFEVGKMLSGGIVGQVEESRTPSLARGDIVTGHLGWQRYAAVTPGQVTKVDPTLAPISTALGVLGMTGLTAYFGLLDIGRPKEGETVVVSGAAGAVGMIVGQIARIKGARAVGIAGSAEKTEYLIRELGFDAAVNYKNDNFREELEKACPQGVDVYFDNVGGEVSDAVLAHLNKGARIPLCGQISMYNLEKPDIGPRIQPQLLINSALMKGFIVGEYAARFGDGVRELAGWLKEDKLKYAENIVDGFENTIEAFLGLFSGENVGKQLVKVAEPR
ncbi:NADP-dependent oxidoreductase [Paenibacillus aurantius]|uniref:NADP-dependent oxidoreductase n=1 Tax=Paenibacillus aurantius TaxID=2918900 RepID=A0AA96RGT2_9BACL|nr:NADP-dependent oxidoreductase [Paenibacillus aurantius]WNQ13377.1 NADP-dependent oxidoreductase [Paenibacillus aurantius]